MKKALIFAMILGSFYASAYGQKKFEIHAGLSAPTGSFAENTSDNFLAGSGCAATGLNAGIKYFYHLNTVKNLSITLGCDVIQNGMSQNFKDKFQESLDIAIRDTPDNYDMSIKVKYSNYINVPVLGGLHYEFPINNNFSLFADACLGFNIASMSDIIMTSVYTGSFQQPSQTASFTFATSNKLASQIGGGILIHNFSIGLHYNQLGIYDYTGKIKSATGSSTDLNSTKGLNISTYTFAIGIKL